MLSIMVEGIQSPAQVTYWLMTGQTLFVALNLLGVACFFYIVSKRMAPLIRGERDWRFDRPLVRLERVLQFWLGQWKHPRYRTAGIMHILLLLAVLSAVRNTVPRGNIFIQCLFRKVRPRNREAGEMGCQRRAPGPGEILRRKDV